MTRRKKNRNGLVRSRSSGLSASGVAAVNPRKGWDEAFATSDLELTDEDREWLEACLTSDEDWTWDEESKG